MQQKRNCVVVLIEGLITTYYKSRKICEWRAELFEQVSANIGHNWITKDLGFDLMLDHRLIVIDFNNYVYLRFDKLLF